MITMKKIFLLCLLLSAGYSTSYAQVEGEATPFELGAQPQATYASLLNDVISNLSKEAYSDQFIPVLKQWDPSKTTIAKSFGVLKELEFQMKTLHLKPEWKEVQVKWRANVTKATEKTDVVILLKELEENLLPGAFEKTWSRDREAWLAKVKAYLNK